MSRLRDESGFTLTELLVAMGLTLVVLTATLTTLDSFVTANQRNLTANDLRETARIGVDRVAREVRNAAGPGLQTPPVERGGPYELVFDSVDPQGAGGGLNSARVRRIRICLDQSNPKTGRLWRQVETWVGPRPALAVANACPHNSYGSQGIVAEGVVNHAVQRNGANPAIFSYDTANLTQLTGIAVELLVDTNIDRVPRESTLNTSVRLRNRNRTPVASFTATPQAGGHVLLNAGGSSDPEGQTLKYSWTCDGLPCPSYVNGQVVDYQPATLGSHSFALTVEDTGGLKSTSPTQTVVVQ